MAWEIVLELVGSCSYQQLPTNPYNLRGLLLWMINWERENPGNVLTEMALDSYMDMQKAGL